MVVWEFEQLPERTVLRGGITLLDNQEKEQTCDMISHSRYHMYIRYHTFSFYVLKMIDYLYCCWF